MNWYIGQEIICVKNQINGLLTKGKVYTIKSLCESRCNCPGVDIYVGIHADRVRWSPNVRCTVCLFEGTQPDMALWTNEKYFAPLDQDISELTEILENSNKETV